MKLGYKVTDKDMKCRNFQYQLGMEYMITKDKKIVEVNTISGSAIENSKLELCSNNVIHYCNELKDCFNWYNIKDGSRYFKVMILGDYKDDHTKSGTQHLKFLEEISKEEIDAVEKKIESDRLDERLKLGTLRKLQNNYPNLIVGGSISLYLQGVKLKRLEDNGVHDFDLIHPYWVDLSEIGAKYIDEKNSGNTFDSTFELDGVLLDLVIDSKSKYSVVEFNGHKYKVNEIEQVLEYKIKYAQQKNGGKHKNDIREMLNLKLEDE